MAYRILTVVVDPVLSEPVEAVGASFLTGTPEAVEAGDGHDAGIAVFIQYACCKMHRQAAAVSK